MKKKSKESVTFNFLIRLLISIFNNDYLTEQTLKEMTPITYRDIVVNKLINEKTHIKRWVHVK